MDEDELVAEIVSYNNKFLSQFKTVKGKHKLKSLSQLRKTVREARKMK